MASDTKRVTYAGADLRQAKFMIFVEAMLKNSFRRGEFKPADAFSS